MGKRRVVTQKTNIFQTPWIQVFKFACVLTRSAFYRIVIIILRYKYRLAQFTSTFSAYLLGLSRFKRNDQRPLTIGPAYVLKRHYRVHRLNYRPDKIDLIKQNKTKTIQYRESRFLCIVFHRPLRRPQIAFAAFSFAMSRRCSV